MNLGDVLVIERENWCGIPLLNLIFYLFLFFIFGGQMYFEQKGIRPRISIFGGQMYFEQKGIRPRIR